MNSNPELSPAEARRFSAWLEWMAHKERCPIISRVLQSVERFVHIHLCDFNDGKAGSPVTPTFKECGVAENATEVDQLRRAEQVIDQAREIDYEKQRIKVAVLRDIIVAYDKDYPATEGGAS